MKMKGYSSNTVFVAFLLVCATTISLAGDKIYFDVKVKLSEMNDLLPIKIATVALMAASDWGGVKEFGEGYSLWLKNYEGQFAGVAQDRDRLYARR